MAKRCPICGREDWNYDVVDGWFTFCGDCHHLVREHGAENDLMMFAGTQYVFKSFKHLLIAIVATTRLDGRKTA